MSTKRAASPNPTNERAAKRARVSKTPKPEEPKAESPAQVVILNTSAEDLAVMDWTQERLRGAEKVVLVLKDGPINQAAWARAGMAVRAAGGRLKQVTIKLAGTQPPSEWAVPMGMELRVTRSWAGVPVGVATLMFVDNWDKWEKFLMGAAGDRAVVREELGTLSAYYAVPSGRPRVQHKRMRMFSLSQASIHDLSVLDEVTYLSLHDITMAEGARLPPHLRTVNVTETGATVLRVLELAPASLVVVKFVVTDAVDGEWGRRVGALLAKQPRLADVHLVIAKKAPLVPIEIPARVTTLTVLGFDPTFGPGDVRLRELECLAVPITAPDWPRFTRLVRASGRVGPWVAGVPSITELVLPASMTWYVPLLPNLKAVNVVGFDYSPATWSRVMCALAATSVPVELTVGDYHGTMRELPEGTATHVFRAVPLDMIPPVPNTRRPPGRLSDILPEFPVDPSREPEATPRAWLQPAVRKVVRQNMSLRDLCIGTLATRRAIVGASRLPGHLANEVADKVAEWISLGSQ